MGIGYEDTPILPGMPWRVHDPNRPLPPVVTPRPAGGPVAPPSDAVMLFDGRDGSGWVSAKTGEPNPWKIENGYMEVVPKSGSIMSKIEFGSCQIHLEWASPAEVVGASQGRGNSGVFLMRRYEIQVLDSYDNPTYADGTAGSIYGQYPPLVNACRKPGEWQTYDIVWQAPLFDGDKLARPAVLSLVHNGVVLHHARELMGATTHRQLPVYTPHPPRGALELQDHNNPVRFRNIWYRPLD